jgi:hypothetical protein
MKRFLCTICGLALALSLSVAANAVTIELNAIDTAPNIYGSPNFDSWKNGAYDAVTSVSFVNQTNSHDPSYVGTNQYAAADVVVYNTGDLGSRLHAIYWVPNETIADLTGHFAVSVLYEWDNVWYDAYGSTPGGTWLQPSRWEEYNKNGYQGVIGSMGMAYDGSGNIPGTIQDVENYAGDILYRIRYTDDSGNVTYSQLTAEHTPAVPLPPSAMLLGSGLLGLVGLGWRRKQSS